MKGFDIFNLSIMSGMFFLVDYFSKKIVKIYSNKINGKKYLFIILSYKNNTGAFFGIGSSFSVVIKILSLIVIPIIFLLGIFSFYYFFCIHSICNSILISLIFGGCLGNIYERVKYKFKVTDFLQIKIGRIKTGIMNLADIYITVGIIMFYINNLEVIINTHF